MRRLLESLAPAGRPISWKWIGSMFAFYVVTMTVAAVWLAAPQHSTANLAPEAGATVATRKEPAAAETRGQGQLVQYGFE